MKCNLKSSTKSEIVGDYVVNLSSDAQHTMPNQKPTLKP